MVPRPLIHSPAISRYIARMFALRILFVLAGLLAILQTMDVIGESNRILSVAGASEGDLWTYVLLRLPLLVSQFIPFAVLLASLITLGTLAVTSQVVIMRSLGLSAHQIMMPMVAVGAVCAGLHLLWNETVTVRTAPRLAAWQATGYGADPANTTVGLTWTMAGDSVIRARVSPLDDGGIALDDVAIFPRPNAGAMRVATLAARGILAPDGRGLLENARMVAADRADSPVIPTLAWSPGLTPAAFLPHEVNPDHNTFVTLLAAVRAAGAAPGSSFLQSELYHKLARPLASLFMPLLATVAAFGLSRAGNVLLRAGIGLGLGFTYFVFDNFVMAMGHSGSLPAPMAAYLATLLFIIMGEAILFRTEQ